MPYFQGFRAFCLPLGSFQRQPVSSTATTRMYRTWNKNETFFRFTRGRFLSNDAQELARRYIRFNVDELARIAAEACGSSQCVEVDKFADGMYNKSLLLTMDNGSQVVANVPNPNAGRPHFTTASEVATMDFVKPVSMRSVLRTPVPQVISWNSRKNNPVGAEYIIMEKAPGVQLDQIWARLDVGQRWKVTQSLAKYQRLWTDVSFAQFGSLYYKHDDLVSAPSLVYYSYTNGDVEEVFNDRFAVGPSNSRQTVDDGRVNVDFDRGPWNTATEYETATGTREINTIQALPIPKSPIAIYAPETYRPSKDKKMAAAQGYLRIVPWLVPPDKSIQASHIWHDDLHGENIFVNPDDPSEVLGFIDWQATELSPLYDHVPEPFVLDYDGPPLDSLLHRPNLEEIRKLFDPDAASQKSAERLFAKMSLVALYRRLIQKTNQRLLRAMQFRETTSFDLLLFARNLFVDGEAAYLALLEDQQRNWSGLPGVQEASTGNPPFPIHFSAEEASLIQADCEGAATAMDLTNEVQECAGKAYFRTRGLVGHEQFTRARHALSKVKEEMVKKHARNDEEVRVWNDVWPFDGHSCR